MRDNYENQLDAIRIYLYEQTKDMTNSEAARTSNENARKIAEQYGIVMVQAASVYARNSKPASDT